MNNLEKHQNTPLKTSKSILADERFFENAKVNSKLIYDWLQSFESKNTQDNYFRVVKSFFKSLSGLFVKDITHEHINYYIEELKKQNKSRATIKLHLSALSSFFELAVDFDLIPKNPVRRAKKIKVQNDNLKSKILTKREVDQILASALNIRDEIIIRFLYLTGIRVSELIAIQWSSFKEYDEYVEVKVWGKGEKLRRIYIDHDFFNEIKMLQNLYDFKKKDHLFQSVKGVPLSRQDIFNIVKEVSLKAEVRVEKHNGKLMSLVSPHWLRHAHASHSLNNGAPIHVVRDTLGHTSISTTNVYLNTTPGQSSGNYLK